MNRKLYILSDTFQPNTAPVNRFLAFAKGYGELGFNVNVVLVCPNKEKSKVEASSVPRGAGLAFFICAFTTLCVILFIGYISFEVISWC